jgi:FMN phosphatase YigB (HAD superfamily)
MPGARDFIQAIAPHFKLAILTNGFEQTQQTKLACCGLGGYFEFMLSSEGLGHAKPSQVFFEAALNQAQAEAADCLYIGDTFRTDVRGGVEAGIRTAWYLREREAVEAERQDSAEWKDWAPIDPALYVGCFQHLPQIQEALLTGI